jgi:LmbE family N-acetylglucosaminyl deacetylase
MRRDGVATAEVMTMLGDRRPRRVLALAPHTDDAELGFGGTIARLLEERTEIVVAAFSSCAQSLPAETPDRALALEFAASIAEMGLGESGRRLYEFPVRRFREHRQDILQAMIELKREIVPDVVFLPASTDIHQDHEVIHQEGVRAFARAATVLGYELPWNMRSFHAQHFVRLEPRHIERKLAFLACYKTQAALRRPYFSPDFIESLARVRGVQSGTALAEAFEVSFSVA